MEKEDVQSPLIDVLTDVWPEVDLKREQPKQRRAYSDKQKCASDLQRKKGEEEEKKGRGRKKKISWSVQVRGGEARSAQG